MAIEIYLRHSGYDRSYAGLKETRELWVRFCEHFLHWIKRNWKEIVENTGNIRFTPLKKSSIFTLIFSVILSGDFYNEFHSSPKKCGHPELKYDYNWTNFHGTKDPVYKQVLSGIAWKSSKLFSSLYYVTGTRTDGRTEGRGFRRRWFVTSERTPNNFQNMPFFKNSWPS
jgi:hypothetical protein